MQWTAFYLPWPTIPTEELGLVNCCGSAFPAVLLFDLGIARLPVLEEVVAAELPVLLMSEFWLALVSSASLASSNLSLEA